MMWWADERALGLSGFRKRLTRAAGISSVILVCHPQTWTTVAWIARTAKKAVDARVDSGAVRVREDGLAEITLSGVQLAAIMHGLRTACKPDTYVAGWVNFADPHLAVARRAYLAMARTVEQVSSTHTGTIPPIVIDDRTPGTGAAS